jgi:predicted dehydrogenase
VAPVERARTRYAQVGLGLRSWMYSAAIVNLYPDTSELVALCEGNAGRLAARLDWARSQGCDARAYAARDFPRLLSEARPDCVVVATPDRDHDHYAVLAMEAGCDVILEKPMTIDAARCQRLLDVQRETGRRVRVTFNYRYSPPRAQVRRLLAEGAVGDVLSVDFQWLLDTTHGADYFRRWHRRKEGSGGLLVHKASHHFDLVDWWLDTTPESVFATGQRRFYTPEQAERYGLAGRGERCLDCGPAARCPFVLDLRAAKLLESIYLAHEEHDGYHRDRCVFSDEIDIEDAMQVIVGYANGVRMSYSLHAFAPWEGYRIAFNGTRGRLEHELVEKVVVSGVGAGEEHFRTRVCPHFAEPYEVEPERGDAAGGHGGGDRLLLADLFAASPPPDPLGRAADHRAGAWSALTGIAANRSIELGRPVRIDELVTGLERGL